MTLIDSRGRFFGRVSVVDALAAIFLLSLSPMLIFAYRVGQPLQPRITAVRPEELVSSAAFQVHGAGFQPDSRIWVGDRAAQTEYFGSDLLAGYVPADLSPGNYAVSVKGPAGQAAAWAREMKIVDPPIRSKAPVVVLVVFTGLQPEEADYLERHFEAQSRAFPEDSGPRLLRMLKRGPMSSYLRGLREETERAEGKEFVLSNIWIQSDEEEWNGAKRYFYQGQPLLLESRIRLEFSHHPYTGIIQKEPRSEPLPAGEGTAP